MEPLGFVILTIEYRQEQDRVLARCRELSTSTFGDTFEEAQEAILEAIVLHVNTLEDVGERERFFKEHNIKFYRTRPRRHSSISIPPDKHLFYQRVMQPVFQAASA